MVPITNRKTIGDKGFSHCGPVAWNNLPLHLRSDDCTPSLDCFKKHDRRTACAYVMTSLISKEYLYNNNNNNNNNNNVLLRACGRN